MKRLFTIIFITVILCTFSSEQQVKDNSKKHCGGNKKQTLPTKHSNNVEISTTKTQTNNKHPTTTKTNNGNNVFLTTKTPTNNGKYVSPINTNMNEKITFSYQDNVLCPPNVNECYIRPLYTPQETGVENSNAGTIDQYLNKPMKGNFTFHAYKPSEKFTYGGACGLGVRYAMHAGVGGPLWGKNDGWVRSKLNDIPNHYIRDDKVCINKCVKIEYQNKILTIPIMDSTMNFDYNELDLSEEAFKWLEKNPFSGQRPATITFMNCPT
ncbi:Effector protein GPP [Meloidogyne graminicola]|uniref:Effector protein GPP n=1 Tax=Meloidogyne graminicola TaxID=189291 RepID=A0A8S9ZR38_9BILA|nr:Effector protein GPP [Meloidogyne graminicola]